MSQRDVSILRRSYNSRFTITTLAVLLVSRSDYRLCAASLRRSILHRGPCVMPQFLLSVFTIFPKTLQHCGIFMFLVPPSPAACLDFSIELRESVNKRQTVFFASLTLQTNCRIQPCSHRPTPRCSIWRQWMPTSPSPTAARRNGTVTPAQRPAQ